MSQYLLFISNESNKENNLFLSFRLSILFSLSTVSNGIKLNDQNLNVFRNPYTSLRKENSPQRPICCKFAKPQTKTHAHKNDQEQEGITIREPEPSFCVISISPTKT